MSISLTLILEVEMGHVFDVFDALDAFNVKFFIFQNIVWVEGVKVIKPFLQFLKVYDLHQVHNMLSITLDPCFKFVENYLGHGDYIFVLLLRLTNEIIPFLMIIFKVLNLIVQACTTTIVGSSDFIEENNNIFSVSASMKSSHAFIVGELFLFLRGYL
jgi:hypothetical protein